MRLTHLFMCIVAVFVGVAAGIPASAWADEGDDAGWIERIRPDHPRLLFNDDSWPAVRARAEGPEAPEARHFAALRERVAALPDDLEPGDYGHDLMTAAFIYRVTGEPALLEKIRAMLAVSVEYYHARYDAQEPVGWYNWSRLGWLAALDWVWDELDEDERARLGRRMIEHVQQSQTIGRRISREGMSGPTMGYYGMPALLWFTGLVFHDEGIDDDAAREMLVEGHALNRQMLDHRAAAVNREGGSASGTLLYAMAAYPIADWHFLYTWTAAIGEDAAKRWPHAAWYPTYFWWNWLPGDREFGYGDAHHVDNELSTYWLGLNMSHVMHFFGESHPEQAALAAHLRDRVRRNMPTTRLSVHPFLMTGLDAAPPAAAPADPPLAKHFEGMGQVFFRSGTGEHDTYAMVSAGGGPTSHRHLDAGHFGLYHRGFLALDTGTRRGTLPQLHNYYGQTIAHNSLLIHMPGEPPTPYWYRTPDAASGGQYQVGASRVTAFHSSDHFAYLACDLTETYRPEKCELVLRQVVFLPPNHFVLFDRVRSTDPTFEKTWLLHTAHEPALEGRHFVADQEEGRLIGTTLLPAGARARAVGGPGREFLVEGVNYPIAEADLVDGEVPELMGRWRIEIRPTEPGREHLFLHVLEVGDQTLTPAERPEPEVTVRDDRVLVTLEALGKACEIALPLAGATSGDGDAGHMRITDTGRILYDGPLANP